VTKTKIPILMCSSSKALEKSDDQQTVVRKIYFLLFVIIVS